MKHLVIFLFIALAFSVNAQTVTRDFATVAALRASTKDAKKGEKVYVVETKNLYAVDYVDNTSTDDGYNTILQGNRRWKCVSCNVPSRCITQSNLTVSDPLNPTYNEIKTYIAHQKIPKTNGVFLNYYKKTDTTGINPAYPYFELGYDSSRVSSIKINGIEILSSPIWFYQGRLWVYNDNSLVNQFNTNKPSGINWTVDDDDLESTNNIVISNITGGIFTGEITTEYFTGSSWESYTEVFSSYYNISSGSGSCSNPLRTYLVQDTAIITIKSPITSNQTDFTDLTLGKSTLAGPRSLNFTSSTGSFPLRYQNDGSLSFGSSNLIKLFQNGTIVSGSVFALTNNQNNFLGSETYSNILSHYSRVSLYKSRGSSTSRLPVSNSDVLGVIEFSGNDGGGASQLRVGEIRSVVTGTVSSGSIPNSMIFSVGANGLAERMRINSDGSILITPVTFSQLPTSSVVVGSIRVINDASSVTYRGNASGGGANVALVMWTGSGWIYQ